MSTLGTSVPSPTSARETDSLETGSPNSASEKAVKSLDGRLSSLSNCRVLFVALVNNVGSERVISEIRSHGVTCALLGRTDFYCAQTTAIAQRFPIPKLPSVWLETLFVCRRLERVARDWRPALVVPLDDISAWLLRSLATRSAVSPSLRDLLVRSLGSPGGYSTAVNRQQLMDLATRLGVRKPHHRAATSLSTIRELRDWQFPVFVKTEHSCGGAGVTSIRDIAELDQRLPSLLSAGLWRSLVRRMKRLLCAQAGFAEASDANLLIQSYAEGVPAFRTVVTWNGRVLDGISFAAERIHPEPTGASTIVRPVDNREMEEIATTIAAELGCSGFISFDFMLDEESGRATLIEMNPRCVNSCHLGKYFGHDLCAVLVEVLTGQSVARRASPLGYKRIALFPKELERDPSSSDLRSADTFHDVPADEPAVIAAYLRRLRQLYPARTEEIAEIIRRAPQIEGKIADYRLDGCNVRKPRTI